MKSKLSFLLVSVMLLLTACQSAAPAPAAPSTPQPAVPAPAPATPSTTGGGVQFVSLATASLGGTFYTLGSSLVQIWNTNLPNVKAVAQASSGTNENVQILSRKEAQFALLLNDSMYDAVKGEGTFAGKKQDYLRLVGFVTYVPRFIVVRTDANINSVADLKGKKLWGGPAKATGIHNSISQLLTVHGLDPEKDVEFVFSNNSQGVEAFRDGGLQVYVSGAGAVDQLLLTGKGKLLPITQAKIAELQQKFPLNVAYTAKPNTLTGQKEPYYTFAPVGMLAARSDTPDDLVYQIVKATYENGDMLRKINAAAADATIEKAMVGAADFPIHPGAERYYKEKGITR